MSGPAGFQCGMNEIFHCILATNGLSAKHLPAPALRTVGPPAKFNELHQPRPTPGVIKWYKFKLEVNPKKMAKKQNRATVTKYLPKDRLRGQKVIKHFISHMERANQGYQDTSVLQVIVVMTPTQISWFLPAGSYHPSLLNASVLGCVAGVQISSGSSVSCAVKPAVVFGTSRAQFQSRFACIISTEHFGFRDWSHCVCVSVRECVVFIWGGFCWRLQVHTCLLSVLADFRNKERHHWGCLAVTFFLCRRLVVRHLFALVRPQAEWVNLP